MTPDEFKAWRLKHNLSHQAAADLLGASSRFVVLRWEAGSEMPSTMAVRIADAEKVLASLPPGESMPKAPDKPKYDYSKHQCWDLRGQPITMADAIQQPTGFQFYRLDSSHDIDPETEHLKANLYETTRKFPRGQCTYFFLDLVDWQVVCVAYPEHPAHIAALPRLQSYLQPKAGV